MNKAKYTLIDCATDLSYGPFELLDRARYRAEVGNIAKWEIINRHGKLVAWSKPEAASWPNAGTEPRQPTKQRTTLGRFRRHLMRSREKTKLRRSTAANAPINANGCKCHLLGH